MHRAKWNWLMVMVKNRNKKRSDVVSWHANSAPLLSARWQMHTGGPCTWPSAIRADTLIYHPQPWIIVLLSLSLYASACMGAHTHNRTHTQNWSAFWFEARAEWGSRSIFAQFNTTVTEILSISGPQNMHWFFFFFCLRQSFSAQRDQLFWLQDPLNLPLLYALFGKDWVIYDLEGFRTPNEDSWIVWVCRYVWFTVSMCVPVSCIPAERLGRDFTGTSWYISLLFYRYAAG